MNILFTDDAWEDYLYWQQTDKQTLRKINQLLKEIQRTPFTGTGKPEPLKHQLVGRNKFERKRESAFPANSPNSPE